MNLNRTRVDRSSDFFFSVVYSNCCLLRKWLKKRYFQYNGPIFFKEFCLSKIFLSHSAQKLHRNIFLEIFPLFPDIFCVPRAIPNTFLKNDLDLAIFDKKVRNFFSPKVFSRPLRHIEPKKNQKKNLSKKWMGLHGSTQIICG